jgi:alpha-1,2-mannosyltransferase
VPVSPYLYPPPFALAVVPLSALPYDAARIVWAILSAAAALGAFVLSGRLAERWATGMDPDAKALVIGLVITALGLAYPIFVDLKNGQANHFAVLLTGAALVLSRRPAVAGASLAAAAQVKIVPALFLVWFGLSRRFSALAAFAVAGVILSAVPWLAGAGHAWPEFWRFAASSRVGGGMTGNSPPELAYNLGIAGNVTRILGRDDPLIPLLSASVLGLLTILLLLRWRFLTAEGRALGLSVLMTLFTPFTWIHSLVLLLPGLLPASCSAAAAVLARRSLRRAGLFLLFVLACGLPYVNISRHFCGISAEVISRANLAIVLAIYGLTLFSPPWSLRSRATSTGPAPPCGNDTDLRSATSRPVVHLTRVR